jgi:hypothetical protein
MDLLSIRQAYISQQLEFKQENLKFEIARERARLGNSQRRLELANTRHKLLAEIDTQFAMDLVTSKVDSAKVEQ